MKGEGKRIVLKLICLGGLCLSFAGCKDGKVITMDTATNEEVVEESSSGFETVESNEPGNKYAKTGNSNYEGKNTEGYDDKKKESDNSPSMNLTQKPSKESLEELPGNITERPSKKPSGEISEKPTEKSTDNSSLSAKSNEKSSKNKDEKNNSDKNSSQSKTSGLVSDENSGENPTQKTVANPTQKPVANPTPNPTPKPAPTAHVHDFQGFKVYKDSTCTALGEGGPVCTICNEWAISACIPLKEHSFVSSVISEGDCLVPRIVQYTCGVCGYVKTEESYGEHKWNTVEETYFDGATGQEVHTTRTYCTVCGKEK